MGEARFCVCPHTTRLETGEVKECGGECRESGGIVNDERNKICAHVIESVQDLLLSQHLVFQ